MRHTFSLPIERRRPQLISRATQRAGDCASSLLVLAAHDPLRDEGMALARRMAAEGNEVTLIEYQGLAHGYLVQGAVVRAARWALRQFGQCLRDALRGE